MCSKHIKKLLINISLSINCFVCVTSEKSVAGIERLRKWVGSFSRLPNELDHLGDTMVLTACWFSSDRLEHREQNGRSMCHPLWKITNIAVFWQEIIVGVMNNPCYCQPQTMEAWRLINACLNEREFDNKTYSCNTKPLRCDILLTEHCWSKYLHERGNSF